jgi:hypothetical protein
MPKYYRADIARWEGEGGAPAKTVDPKTRTVGFWQIVCVVAILTGSVLYARQKGWM